MFLPVSIQNVPSPICMCEKLDISAPKVTLLPVHLDCLYSASASVKDDLQDLLEKSVADERYENKGKEGSL